MNNVAITLPSRYRSSPAINDANFRVGNAPRRHALILMYAACATRLIQPYAPARDAPNHAFYLSNRLLAQVNAAQPATEFIAPSTTRAGITGISGIAGNTSARTGDAPTGLKPVFTQQDADKINKSLSVQTSVTATFGQNASKAIGDYGASKTAPVDQARAYQDLKGKESAGNLSPAEQTRLASMEQNGYTPDKAQAALNNPQNQADYANWKEGGPARVAAHTIVGGLTGGTNGAFGAATSQTVVPLLGEQLASLDIPADLKKGIILAAGLSIGVATGGVGGGRCSRRWSASGRPLAWAR
jgi:hypothetical protein